MRTDAIIDKRQVHCPHASTIGYGKWKAQVGDLVLFDEDHKTRFGRMIARVHYATSYDGKPPIKDYLLLVVISDTLDYTFERWINPDDVTRVVSPRNQKTVIDWFLSDDIVKRPVDLVRRSTSDGWTTLSAYLEWLDKREADLKDFERRHPKGICQCKLCKIVASEQSDQEVTDNAA